MSFAKQFRGLFSRVYTATATINPAAFVDNESQEFNVTVTGARVGDFVLVAPGVDLTEATYSAQVTATGNVAIVLSMTGGDTNDVASSTWNICVLGY